MNPFDEVKESFKKVKSEIKQIIAINKDQNDDIKFTLDLINDEILNRIENIEQNYVKKTAYDTLKVELNQLRSDFEDYKLDSNFNTRLNQGIQQQLLNPNSTLSQEFINQYNKITNEYTNQINILKGSINDCINLINNTSGVIASEVGRLEAEIASYQGVDQRGVRKEIRNILRKKKMINYTTLKNSLKRHNLNLSDESAEQLQYLVNKTKKIRTSAKDILTKVDSLSSGISEMTNGYNTLATKLASAAS